MLTENVMRLFTAKYPDVVIQLEKKEGTETEEARTKKKKTKPMCSMIRWPVYQ